MLTKSTTTAFVNWLSWNENRFIPMQTFLSFPMVSSSSNLKDLREIVSREAVGLVELLAASLCKAKMLIVLIGNMKHIVVHERL